MANLLLFPNDPKPCLVHKAHHGKRKTARKLPRRRPIHLILSSRFILLTHRAWIEAKIRDYSQRFGIRLHRYAICGDHVHFAIEIPHADYYKKFIRSLTGVLARKMGRGLWNLLPFTRVASWGVDFRNLVLYIEKNQDETDLLRRYEPRRRPGRGRDKKHPPATLAPGIRRAL